MELPGFQGPVTLRSLQPMRLVATRVGSPLGGRRRGPSETLDDRCEGCTRRSPYGPDARRPCERRPEGVALPRGQAGGGRVR